MKISGQRALVHARQCKFRPLSRYYSVQIGAKNVSVEPNEGPNPVGIYYLNEPLRTQVFGKSKRQTDPKLIEVSKNHLNQNGLLGKPTKKPDPIEGLDLPSILGKDLDEHFQKIGRHLSEPYLSWCHDFIDRKTHPENVDPSIPPIPKPESWVAQSGWTRYTKDGVIERVEYPKEAVICFDVEVLYKIHDFSILATAVSRDAWYCWISPWLLGETENERQLISLGPHDQVVIGHNIGYDRKRVKEEYSLEATGKFFLDTMSLHIATNGMCSQQRPHWLKRQRALKKRREESGEVEDLHQQIELDNSIQEDAVNNPWLTLASMNSLSHVYAHHYGGEGVDKTIRDSFAEMSRENAVSQLNSLIDYCAQDVNYTKLIFNKLLPSFLELCPHPVSFGALRPMSSLFLPVNEEWKKFLHNADAAYNNALNDTLERLKTLAEEYATYVDDPEKLAQAKSDPWLSQLDWTVVPIRMKKGKKKDDPPVPAKNQKFPGKPEWYKSLFPSSTKPMNLTTRTRITPLLLRLKWDEHPLFWIDKYGWCFKVPLSRRDHYEDQNYSLVEIVAHEKLCVFRVHHKDGAEARCVNPMAKSYIQFFENGTLSSDSEAALAAIKANAQCSYWVAARERIQNQMPVYQKDSDMGFKTDDWGMILPRMIPMGTVTRRAVEDTWLTASNAKSSRIGSELKAMVRAPEGYKFVGADVDSEELWIASMMGDSLFGIHGGSALGWMTLEGTKKEGTDLHSKTASIMGISRDQAKIFNYGRIYGAGQKFAFRLLKQFNPKLSDVEAENIAKDLYRATKGAPARSKVFEQHSYWHGGSESLIFNQLELMARQDHQRSPVLGAGITTALLLRNLNEGRGNGYLTSRVNWGIQSSGVDYLHLLIASMYYLCKVYDIHARLFLTVHDEIRFMVKDEDVDRASLALQISNLWTRAMFCQQLGIDDVPHSVAFFSLIDTDFVLRKEVDHSCVTPSHPDAIPPGTAFDIKELLAKCNSLGTPNLDVIEEFQNQKTVPRKPVMEQIHYDPHKLEYIMAQVAPDKESVRNIENMVKATHVTPKTAGSRTITSRQSVFAAEYNGDMGFDEPNGPPRRPTRSKRDPRTYNAFKP